MDRCAYQQQQNNNNDCNTNNGVWLSGGGEMMNDVVVCPRPRRRVDRLNPYVNDSIISSSSPRWQQYYAIDRSDLCDSVGGSHLLDLIFTKECYVTDRANNPFFCGSPPSRASNPLIQDARFANENPWPFSTGFEVSPSSSARPRVKFGQMPTTVRAEGFSHRGISTFA